MTAIFPIATRTSYFELHRAFDAATAIRADLVLFERDEPAAPAALQTWALHRNRTVVHRDLGAGLSVLSVATSNHRHIDVYLLPERIP